MLKFAVALAVIATLASATAEAQQGGGPGGCASSGPRGWCWVGATDPGRPGGPAQVSGAPGRPSGHGGQGAPSITCTDQAWTAPPPGDPLWGGHDPSHGSLKFQMCQGGGGAQAWPRVVFAPNSAAIVLVVSPDEVARQAISKLGLSAPDIRLSPPADSPHGATVGFPVWMWSGRSEATTGPVTRRASAGPVSVTATATLARISWAMGDGAAVICPGPGTEFTDDKAGQFSPTCGHVYLHKAADGAFTIAATSHWEIRWSGGGQSAFQTLDLTSQARLPVREIRTLNTQGE